MALATSEARDLHKTTRTLFSMARKLRVDGVRYEFSGSCDSGDLNDVILFVRVGEEEEPLSRTCKSEDQWGSNPNWTEDHNTLLQLCHTYFDSHLSERIGWDWYNNEGGGGEILLNFRSGEVKISGYYMVEESVEQSAFNLLKTMES